MSAENIPGVSRVNGSTTATDHGDYWEVDVHSTTIIFIGSGTFENVLINTNRNICQVNATGRGWTVRNVGWNGIFPDIESGAQTCIGISGDGLIENVYMGDGGPGNWRDKHPDGPRQYQSTGIFSTNQNVPGEVTIRDVYCGNWVDNGMYLENQGGRIDYTFERVYGHDNDISLIRPGQGNHVLRDCHGHSNTHRDVWNRVGTTITLEDCQFENVVGSYNATGTTQVGAGANPQRPESVPATAMEAATGESGAGPGPSGPFDEPVCVRHFAEQ